MRFTDQNEMGNHLVLAKAKNGIFHYGSHFIFKYHGLKYDDDLSKRTQMDVLGALGEIL